MDHPGARRAILSGVRLNPTRVKRPMPKARLA
jgi:hypothetical protein